MFQTVPLSHIRSFSLYTQQWYMLYRYFLKHVKFYSKNKFEKLVHLVGFIIRICHDARSSECQSYWTLKFQVFTLVVVFGVVTTCILVGGQG